MADEVSGEQGRLRTFGEREVFRTPDVWFGQVDVELPDGERVWEPVLRLHQVAVMALVDAQERVLLARRHRFVADRWGWELPGGPVDEGEDPDQAAARIVEDAAGYRAGRVERLIAFQPMADTVGCEHVVFTGREPVQVGDPVEGGRVEWVPLASVPGLIADGQVWSAATLLGLMRLVAMSAPGVSG